VRNYAIPKRHPTAPLPTLSPRGRGLLFAALLTLATPAWAESILHARLNADIQSSDPRSKRDENTDAVLLHVVEGLVAPREDGSVGPMLASRWTISPDGRTYSFALRRDVRFHDGTPLTAADVVWSLQRYMAPDSHWRCKVDLGPNGLAYLQSVKAADPYTVIITLGRPAPLFLKTLARPDCAGAGIIARSSIGPDGAWRAPIGTGPFRWAEWRRNQFVDVVRFPGYRSLPGPRDGNGGGKHALVDRVRFTVIPDGSAASAALLRGSLDVLDGLATNELGGVQGVPGIQFSSAPTMDFFSVLLQTRDPVLADPRIRRALALSIDAASLTRVAAHGMALADSSPVPVVSPFHGPAQRALIRRDVVAARALLKAAGYHGQPISLITSHSPPEMYDIAIIVQAMARDAGLKLEITTLDWAAHLARYSRGDYQAMVFSFSPRLDPSLIYYATLIGDKRVEPRKAWDSPIARALLERSSSTDDPKARQAAFDALEAQFRRDTPAIVLYNTRRVTAFRSYVYGYRSWPAQLQRLWDVGMKAH
jgi:peptide/nickel transport system substrate-binding protein